MKLGIYVWMMTTKQIHLGVMHKVIKFIIRQIWKYLPRSFVVSNHKLHGILLKIHLGDA